MTSHLNAASDRDKYRGKRLSLVVAGILIFALIYFSPAWPDAFDPMGKNFALSREGKGALAIALLTVSYQAVKAATANPVEALRYE